MTWTPDGRIVYSSGVSGNSDLWIMNPDGSNPRQLTDSPAADQAPAISPDGRTIVFVSTRAGKRNLWQIDMDGGNLKQLTSGEQERYPTFSPDGRWVIYDSWHGDIPQLWKIPFEGGSPMRFHDGPASRPVASPDGKFVAYAYSDRQTGGRHTLDVMPFEGGAPVKTLNYTPASFRFDLSWSPDSRSLIYVDARQGGANLWSLPLDGSPPQPLTNFTDEQISSFDVTSDGKRFVVARGTVTSDVVLITDLK